MSTRLNDSTRPVVERDGVAMDVWTYGRMDVWTYGRMDELERLLSVFLSGVRAESSLESGVWSLDQIGT